MTSQKFIKDIGKRFWRLKDDKPESLRLMKTLPTKAKRDNILFFLNTLKHKIYTRTQSSREITLIIE